MGITRLLDHVARCWQPSWYDFAGVLLPPSIHRDYGIVTSRPHAKEQSSTGIGSNTSPPLAMANPVTTEARSDRHTNLPSPLHPVPLPSPLPKGGKHAGDPRGAFTSAVEEADTVQSPVTPPSSKQEAAPINELGGSNRPRRQARERAMAKIRQSQGQPKKRSRPSGSQTPAAKRRKAPANSAVQHPEAMIEEEEEKQDKTDVEDTSQAREEAISPIKGTLIQNLHDL